MSGSTLAASHIPSSQVGSGFVQETHPERLFADCSEYFELVSQAAQMPRAARSAVRHAPGRGAVSGPAISGDVLHRDVAQATGSSYMAGSSATATPPPEQVQAPAERPNAADTVALSCGAGVQGAHAEVMEPVGRLHSPIGHTPPPITAAQVKGFAIAAGKTVLDGVWQKIIEMARANVRNIPRPTITR